jgi:dipeptidyl aminopeptidase/acylaminoacyl peptidase
LVLLALALLSLALAATLFLRQAATPSAPASGGPRLAYFEFGRNADLLWLVEPASGQRQRLFALPHASDFGIVPQLAPDGRRFAYTALPPNTAAPSAAAPAGLWLAGLAAEPRTRLIAVDVDLLVKPQWSPDGRALVFRRSAGDRPGLYLADLTTNDERLLVGSSTGLFPVAFAPDGSSLYYAALSTTASDLYRIDLRGGSEPVLIARLYDGLTRDWALSPAGDRLAFLALSLDGGLARSRALLLDLASGQLSAISDAAADDFSPVWAGEDLTLGRSAGGPSGLIKLGPDRLEGLPAPTAGFDVPLAFSAGAGYAVRSFSGSSTTSPGRATLAVISPDGSRHPIASGEVTLLGWTHP